MSHSVRVGVWVVVSRTGIGGYSSSFVLLFRGGKEVSLDQGWRLFEFSHPFWGIIRSGLENLRQLEIGITARLAIIIII